MNCNYNIDTLEAIATASVTDRRTIATFSGASVSFRTIRFAKCRLVRTVGVVATFNARADRYRYKFPSHIVERLKLVFYAVAIFRPARQIQAIITRHDSRVVQKRLPRFGITVGNQPRSRC